MQNNEILSKEDIIFDDKLNIEMILNKNYSDLRRSINLYFMSLLLDIKIGSEGGYSFYNEIIDDYHIYGEKTFMIEILEVEEDIKFLESLIVVENKSIDKLLDIFYTETMKDYKIIENELLVYIRLVKIIIADKVRI